MRELLSDIQMELSDYLEEADRKGQLKRIDIDVLKPGAWSKAYDVIRDSLGFSDKK